jgi:hypothetical protein
LPQADRVVLLHGIAPQPWSSLRPLARMVEAAGDSTLCVNDPSRSAFIPALAVFVHQRAGGFIHDHPGRT